MKVLKQVYFKKLGEEGARARPSTPRGAHVSAAIPIC